MNRSKTFILSIFALLLLCFSGAPAFADDFELSPFASHDGEQTVIGLQFTFEFGGLLPTGKELAAVWYGDEIAPESMVADNAGAAAPKALGPETDTRGFFARLSGLDWGLIAGAATLVTTELMGETDIFGRDDSSGPGGGQPANISDSVIVNQSADGSVVINSPADNSSHGPALAP